MSLGCGGHRPPCGFRGRADGFSKAQPRLTRVAQPGGTGYGLVASRGPSRPGGRISARSTTTHSSRRDIPAETSPHACTK
ncbi:hypothetical protein SLNWT_4055 [Streptomyces albus]|uniref:Uncharacterized protein n=1 Tax=Streptomyces albus (strain ATCC 21838 / DSM 41398 / FERM P-419 / JCM 4703 / NBRC 107858) TaxID=1081613 RepID=A0A0B5F0P4_STRA4|nr:hypothetical protein SLNWT_4055 [Streptomyces albus]AOU78742.1 hypothetical protein SLNHY_4051 [Streptomyces albus]AYN34478.1 hypothetical protein DUI70_3980 [Streptomyces albus]